MQIDLPKTMINPFNNAIELNFSLKDPYIIIVSRSRSFFYLYNSGQVSPYPMHNLLNYGSLLLNDGIYILHSSSFKFST